MISVYLFLGGVTLGFFIGVFWSRKLNQMDEEYWRKKFFGEERDE